MTVMDEDEFEAGYADRSGLSVDDLRALGRVVRPCYCGDSTCNGWQSVNEADYERDQAVYLSGNGPRP